VECSWSAALSSTTVIRSHTVRKNTIVASGVPVIMHASSATPFNVGLLAYPQARTDGGQYVFVNYWVEQ